MSGDPIGNLSQSVDLVDSCDVVVVGGGLVGSAVAARLAHDGLSVAVLEARRLAGGATGRSMGMALLGLPEPYALAVAACGREQAREIWTLTSEGRERLAETAARLGVPFERRGSLRVAETEEDKSVLHASAELLQTDGFDVWFDHEDPLERGFLASLGNPDDLSINGAELSEALIESAGVMLHEGTEVRGLEADGGGVRVHSKHRTVHCSMAVLAVDGYAALLHDYFADRVEPKRILTRATQPLDQVILEQPFYVESGHVYGRQLPDRRLLLGGWLGPDATTRALDSILDIKSGDALSDSLEAFASRHFPDLASMWTSRWADVTGFTSDGLPTVGRLPDLPQVFFALGLGGHSLSWALVVSDRLARLMLEDEDPGLVTAERFA
ncbi:MAG: FAD-binding oxidoreductase [Chloroflexi bacterium]|nr:FAD-binding oxidoreductase [Chloroflexota bacterium]